MIAILDPPADSDRASPGKRALIDHDTVSGFVLRLDALSGTAAVGASVPVAFDSHVSQPPERPPR